MVQRYETLLSLLLFRFNKVIYVLSDLEIDISISKNLYDILLKKSLQSDFDSINKYVEHLLSQIINFEYSFDINPKEEEEIKKRLENLGYL